MDAIRDGCHFLETVTTVGERTECTGQPETHQRVNWCTRTRAYNPPPPSPLVLPPPTSLHSRVSSAAVSCLPHLADPRVNPTSPLPHALKINVDVVSGGWSAAAAAAGDRRQERSPAAKQLYDAVICLPTRACASTHWLVGAEIR